MSTPKAKNKYPEVRREISDTLDWMDITEDYRRMLLSQFELAYSAGRCDAVNEILEDTKNVRTYEDDPQIAQG